MLDGPSVGNAKAVINSAIDKTDIIPDPEIKAEINNALLENDNGKFNNQLKGVPATGIEFNSENPKVTEPKGKPRIKIDLYTPFTESENGNSLMEIKVYDAVKVNKAYDIHPKLINNTNIRTEFDKWAIKSADILEQNQTSIVIASADGIKYSVDSKFLNNLAETLTEKKGGYKEIRKFFKEDLGLAFFNTVWAIDDLVNNLNTDPFYKQVKEQKKVFDLSSVSKNYQMDNDKADYFGKLRDHSHRGIPVLIETESNIFPVQETIAGTPKEIIKTLAETFDAKGNLNDGETFEKKVYELLDNSVSRKSLIEHFKLNSKENIDSLVPAIIGESGASNTERDYNSYFCVGSVMLNRTLGRNLKKFAKAEAQNIPENKIKPVPVKSILMEEGQFAITWEKVGDTGKTIFDFQGNLNTKYKQGKLKESGNSFVSFKLANEVVTDLLGGMNHLKAEINGKSTKNAGRPTSDLFYFNQSHNDDYSGKSLPDPAVKLIDVNDTQVFFKSWDGLAFFRYE